MPGSAFRPPSPPTPTSAGCTDRPAILLRQGDARLASDRASDLVLLQQPGSAGRCEGTVRIVENPRGGVPGGPRQFADGGVCCRQGLARDAVVMTAQQKLRLMRPGSGGRQDYPYHRLRRAAAGPVSQVGDVGHICGHAGDVTGRLLGRRVVFPGWRVQGARVHVPSLAVRGPGGKGRIAPTSRA